MTGTVPDATPGVEGSAHPDGWRAASRAVPGSPLRYLGPVARYLGVGASVVERQLPFAVLMLLAMLALLLPGMQQTVPGGPSAVLVVAAGLTAVVVVLLAALVPWRRYPPLASEILIVLQFVAIALLRQGSGGMSSPFSGIVLLPALTLSMRAGLPGVAVGTVGAAVSSLWGLLLGPSGQHVQPVVLRAFFVAAIALIIGLVLHETTTRLRARNDALARLQADQAAALQRSQEATAELERAYAVRRAAYDQLVSVIDSATEQAIIATDADGRVEVFNAGAERLLGHPAGEVVGRRHLTDFLLRDEVCRQADLPDQRRFVDALASAAGGRRDWTYVRVDGSHVIVQQAVTRRTEPDGSVAGYVVVATDVTAEREAARLKEEFVGLVSHELRTPLTSVLGYTELLLDGTEELSDDQREYLEIVDRNARRQLRLVSDLLLSAQVDAGTFTISAQETDAASVAQASLAAAAPAAAAAGVALVHDLRPAPLHADAVRLGQAVDNLVSNALKFTERGGTVRVEVEPPEDGGALVRVVDSGIGIPPDELARLTERFYRATTATRRAIPGVGLGLSITKAVVEAHGGTVTVESTVGEGTCFTLALPARPPR